MRRGHAGIYRRGGYAYARAGGAAVAAALLNQAHDAALEEDRRRTAHEVVRQVDRALAEAPAPSSSVPPWERPGARERLAEIKRALGFEKAACNCYVGANQGRYTWAVPPVHALYCPARGEE